MFSSAKWCYYCNTTVDGWITGGNETVYRREIEHLAELCCNTNLSFRLQIDIDFRKRKLADHVQVSIGMSVVERVSSIKFLVLNISHDLSWAQPIDVLTKKVCFCLYLPRRDLIRLQDLWCVLRWSSIMLLNSCDGESIVRQNFPFNIFLNVLRASCRIPGIQLGNLYWTDSKENISSFRFTVCTIPNKVSPKLGMISVSSWCNPNNEQWIPFMNILNRWNGIRRT